MRAEKVCFPESVNILCQGISVALKNRAGVLAYPYLHGGLMFARNFRSKFGLKEDTDVNCYFSFLLRTTICCCPT